MKAGVLCARGALILMADADGATVAADEKRLEESLMALKARPSQVAEAYGRAAVAAAAGGIPASLPANARLGVAVGSRAHMQQQVSSLDMRWRNDSFLHGASHFGQERFASDDIVGIHNLDEIAEQNLCSSH